MNPALRRLRPLGLCLLAAVLLHSLVLALLQLQRQRLKPATASALGEVRPMDNTPELLRFSRNQSEAGTPSIVPLPGFDQLPPPPPPMATRAANPGATAKPRGQSDFVPRKSVPRGQAGRAGDVAARQQHRLAQARPGGAVGGQPGAMAEVETPESLLARLRRLASDPAEARPGQEPSATGSPAGRSEVRRGGEAPGRVTAEGELPLRRPEGAAQQPYQALWESARPEATGPAGLGALPGLLERRSLPLAQARRGGLPINHGEGVLLGDQLMLFWIQADQLWLLRAKLSAG